MIPGMCEGRPGSTRRPSCDPLSAGIAVQEQHGTRSRSGRAFNPAEAEIPPRPARPPEPCWEKIPDLLTAQHQWVLWSWVWDREPRRWTKVLYQPNGRHAKSNDPKTWSTYEDVTIAYLGHQSRWDGVGFVLDSTRIVLVGWDFDHCIDADDKVDPQVEVYVRQLDSYTEVSPSGTGLRVLVLGKLPPDDRRVGSIEVYEDKRFLTITGNRWQDSRADIRENQDAIDSIHAEVFAKRRAKRERSHRQDKLAPGSINLDDARLLERARKAKNGDKFAALYDRGDWQGRGFPSQSEADLALCSMLAFWAAGDATRIDALFRSSALFRKKWNRDDYRERTITQVVSKSGFYDPSRHNGGPHQQEDEPPESRQSAHKRNGARPAPGRAQPQAEAGPMEAELLGERIELWQDDPKAIVEAFLTNRATHQRWRTLHRFQENYFEWSGSYYAPRTDEEIEAKVVKFLYDDVYLLKPTAKVPVAVPVKRSHIDETMRALRNRTHIKNNVEPPYWLGQAAPADLTNVITSRNGILLPGSRTFLDPSPAWFTLNALNVIYDPAATCPLWDKFLLDLWPKDSQSRNTLQEIFGYLLTNDMSQEKIFMLIGLMRSGKGTIATILRALLGDPATASLNLSTLTEGFEREVLIGKSLAMVGDARLGARTDTAKLLDFILSVSGRDRPGIPRKYKSAYTGPLNVRFLICSNETPRFPDPAAAARAIVLKTTVSFLGREDRTLKNKLLTELSGILNWSLDGWERLQERGHFIQPESALDEIDTLMHGGGTVARFVERECQIDGHDVLDHEKARTLKQDLYGTYHQWCEDQKEDRSLSYDVFFQRLKDAYPVVRDFRPDKRAGETGKRPRYVKGIRLLTTEEKETRKQEEEAPHATA
jgi:putative DNA primase/helicase